MKTDYRDLLYRAKEILGAHHADLSPIEREFFEKLTKILSEPEGR
jgi:hypothetical protein